MIGLLDAAARQGAVLEETGHRPWPPPDGRWLLGQTWEDLLFAHWRVPEAALRALVPTALSIDTFGGSAWVGLTPFRLTALRVRGTLPLPVLSSFPEVNVRTYVTLDGKPGIFFLSLDAANPFAVSAARRYFRLPYFRAEMAAARDGDRISFRSRRVESGALPRMLRAQYRPVAAAFVPKAGSREYFLTERYCLYTVHRRQVFRAEIHHRPWQLQSASAEIEENTMLPAPLELPGEEPLLHFAATQDAVIWPLAPVV